jgi:hypothetical protein
MALWGSGVWDTGKWSEIVGQMAATESGSDTFAGEGDVIVTGTMAATESGVDVFASTGNVQVTGQMAATESGVDQFAAEGTVQVTGEMAATESQVDTFTGEGDVINTGTMSATESGVDVFSAEGDVEVTGSMAAVESGVDVFAAEGDVQVTGTMAAVESGVDVFAAEGTVTPSNPFRVEPDIGAEKRRIKKRDAELEAYKRDREALRKLIEETVSPAAKEAKAVALVAGKGRAVGVVPLVGEQFKIPVPATMDAAEVARMVADAVERANAEAIRVKAYKDATIALAVARQTLARIIKRRRDDELLLLM